MGNYLVTGAAGFIGSKLAEALVRQGHQVSTIDNLSTGYLSNIPKGVRFFEGDCQDQEILDKLKNETFDCIYHIAGQSSGEISFDDPVYDLQTNTQSTLQLLQLCRITGCKKLIYASSMSVYGQVADQAIDETHSTIPESFYGIGKVASEHYLRVYRSFGIATCSLRLWNTYGPGQNLENLRQGMVSIFLAQALRDKRIHVKGSPERFRDFVYIDDIVDSFLKAESHILPGKYSVWNVSTGIRTTVAELVELICEKVGGEIEVKFEGNTPGDQFGIYGDSHKMADETGWSPKFSLEEGLEKMVEWAKNRSDENE